MPASIPEFVAEEQATMGGRLATITARPGRHRCRLPCHVPGGDKLQSINGQITMTVRAGSSARASDDGQQMAPPDSSSSCSSTGVGCPENTPAAEGREEVTRSRGYLQILGSQDFAN